MKSKNITNADSNASELSDAALLDVFGGSTEYGQVVHDAVESASGAQVTINIYVDGDGADAHGLNVGSTTPSTDAKAPSNTVEHPIGSSTPASGAALGAAAQSATNAQQPHPDASSSAANGAAAGAANGAAAGAANGAAAGGAANGAAAGAANGAAAGGAPHPQVGATNTTQSNTTQTTTAPIGTGSGTNVMNTDPHANQTQQQQTDSKDGDHHHHHGIREAFEAAHDRFHEQLDHLADGFDQIAHGAGEIAIAAVELNPIVAGVHLLNDTYKKSSSTPPIINTPKK